MESIVDDIVAQGRQRWLLSWPTGGHPYAGRWNVPDGTGAASLAPAPCWTAPLPLPHQQILWRGRAQCARLYPGEHGDSEFAAWSLTNIGGIPVDTFCMENGTKEKWSEKKNQDRREVRRSAYHVIDYKGLHLFCRRRTWYWIADHRVYCGTRAAC